jgi:signal transduction histidine kinase
MRALRLLLWPAGAVLGIAAESAEFAWSEPGDWVPDLAVGWALIACGLVAWSRRSDARSGPLMAATGFAWFAANFTTAGLPALDWLSEQALYLHRGPLVHLVLTYPRGRAAGTLERTALAIGYVAAVFPAVWGNEAVTCGLAAGMLAVAVRGYVRAIGRERRARRAALQATAFLAAILAGTATLRLAYPTQGVTDGTLLAYEVALCGLAGALLAGLLREPWSQAEITDLVVDLGDARSGTLRDALAAALGDPTLEVGYWVGQGYVDAQGHPLAMPAEGADRGITSVERDGEPIALLVHDPAVLDDPGLSDALARAARLAASNARLQAEVLAQVEEIAASRRRLVHAGDEERRRLERRLRETVERRLAELGQTLESAGGHGARDERLRLAQEQLARTLDEVRDLARGLHPRGLENGGLRSALASLATHSPVPVELSVENLRLPDEIGTAAYFVCSEALANVIKSAGASRATISIRAVGERLEVVVDDDGGGGADPSRGSGLRGLADRVEALGGALEIESPARRGTRVTATLPLERAPR